MRTRTLAVAAALAMAIATTVANSADTLTPKQGRLKSATAKAKVPAEQSVGRVIVKMRDGGLGAMAQAARASRVQRLEASAGVGMKHMRDLAGGASLFALGDKVPLSQAKQIAARLARDPSVEYATPDILMKRAVVPNEARFAEWQWNLFAPSSTYSGALLPPNSGTKSATALGGVNMPPAWDLTMGSNSVVVAVIDTGIVNHPDLNGVSSGATYLVSPRFVAGYDFVSSNAGTPTVPANFIANDGDGRDSDPSDPGDWVTAADKTAYPDVCDDGQPGQSDSSWHGSHIAGVLGATGNNSTGIAGIAWNVRVQPIRALGKCGGALSDIAEAVQWAAGLSVPGVPANATPAKVINLSLGGGDCTVGQQFMQDAVTAAINAGSVVVAATGNDGQDGVISPANCAGAIGVTAHTINGENADYANVGTGTAISAPGGGAPTLLGSGGPTDDSNWTGYYIWSTLLFGATDPLSVDSQNRTGFAYGGFTGTSPATPHVAGVAALIKSVQSGASPAFVKSWLTMSSSTRPHPANGVCTVFALDCGHGILDAQKAVQAAVDAVPAVSVNAATRVLAPNGTTSLSGSAVPFSGRTLVSSVWSQTGGTLSATTGPTVTLTAPSAGAVTVTLTATDSAGKVSSDSVIVRVNNPPVLGTTADQTATVGQTVSFVVTATDADGDPLAFSATSLPSGATMSSTGQFSWNTTGATAGAYTVGYHASDPFSDSPTGSVTITLAAAPVNTGGAPAPTGGGGGGGALPFAQLLLLVALGLAARVQRRE